MPWSETFRSRQTALKQGRMESMKDTVDEMTARQGPRAGQEKERNATIGVIVPVYNVRPHLDRCVESVLGQTFRDFELILVDDGSTDGSGSQCEEWAKRDGRVRVFHEANAGQAVARNFGVRQSRGKWIAFVDADDYVAADYLEYLLGLAEKTGAGMAACRYRETHGESLEEGGGGTSADVVEVFGLKEALRRLPTGELRDGPCCKLFLREVLEAFPFPEGRVYEDTAVMGPLVYRAGSVVQGRRELYAYFQNPSSTTHSREEKKLRDQLWANRTAAEFFDGIGETETARLAWDRYRKTMLADIKRGVLPMAVLRKEGKVLGRAPGAWGLVGLKCRLALVWPQGYRLWCRLAGK